MNYSDENGPEKNQAGDNQPRVVLVETSHPGNIGAVARAMKTMALDQLALVNPKEFPHPAAIARATNAHELLNEAKLYPALADAIADRTWVIGVTARSRKLSAICYTPRQLVQAMLSDYRDKQIAWVFGRERNGLTNEELDLCQAICTIPSNPQSSSLNLAAAVQVLAYEWLTAVIEQQRNAAPAISNKTAEPASSFELEGLYDHLWAALSQAEFFSTRNPKPLMRKLRHLIGRAQPSKIEINILRGILKTFMKQ